MLMQALVLVSGVKDVVLTRLHVPSPASSALTDQRFPATADTTLLSPALAVPVNSIGVNPLKFLPKFQSLRQNKLLLPGEPCQLSLLWGQQENTVNDRSPPSYTPRGTVVVGSKRYS